MKFEIHAAKQTGERAIFYFDNMTNVLTAEDGTVFQDDNKDTTQWPKAVVFDKDTPLTKSKQINTLKIQLGLSCNYSCSYCSQKFVERSQETNFKQVDEFVKMLDVIEFEEDVGLRIEFWGGEPLVYLKTIKPLVEALEDKFADWQRKPQFVMVTNGSLLTDETIDWLMMHDFNVGISHDGPGQHVRGPDPMDDPKKRETILGYYRMQSRLKKPISFNVMMNRDNQSRKEIYDWFVNLTGDSEVMMAEGGFVDAYDEDGIASSLQTLHEHFKYRQQAFGEIYASQGMIGHQGIIQKVRNFIYTVLNQINAENFQQRCGMDEPGTIAVDLRGNVLTCQNVSAVHKSHNGEPHLGGNLRDYDNIKLTTSTHWSRRKECSNCPVLAICRGACMYTDGKFWEVTCNNAYSDSVALFALGFHSMTGYIPTLIKGEGLPEERQDVFGTVLGLPDRELYKGKTLPVKVVSEISDKIDDVAVYGQSRYEDIGANK